VDEPGAMIGCQAVLITHEHADHADLRLLDSLRSRPAIDLSQPLSRSSMTNSVTQGTRSKYPKEAIETLFVPVHAPWPKTSEAVT
jgi:L-ascorbate metabolism protein UlaG (beta-lactamase superfamily)